MEEVREFESDFKEDRQEFLQKAKRIKEEKDQLEQQVIELNQSQQAMQRLFNMGVVDEHGNPIGQDQQQQPNVIYNEE